jgi:hypothetical protein
LTFGIYIHVSLFTTLKLHLQETFFHWQALHPHENITFHMRD